MWMTPELSPRIEGTFTFAMTPMMKMGVEASEALGCNTLDDLEAFCLESPAPEGLSLKHKRIRKEKARPRLQSTWHIVDDELERIVEENDAGLS